MCNILIASYRYPNSCTLEGGNGVMATRDRLLTPRRRQIIDYIRRSMERRGRSPSMREIAEAVGLSSVSTISYHLKIRPAAGYLDRDPGQPRTVVAKPSRIQVLHAEPDGPASMVSVPL